ncbi:MAG: hypothetical protein M1818_000225 [Claussenomyces sp. TS43310]|nr:MAG: hypothetical protein M1818_000225 [Claussenomyces sp. TS43310]
MLEYIASGGNRHPSAADWYGKFLAYGTDRNIALWEPEGNGKGVTTLLVGHTDVVNAVQFVPTPSGLLLISGSVDRTVRIWRPKVHLGRAPELDFECIQALEGHENSVNCIAATASTIVTGSADATLRIWSISQLHEGGSDIAELQQSITLKPRFFPLAVALSPLSGAPNSHILAVAGTAVSIQIYISNSASDHVPEFKLQATLSGHEGWIRSLSFINERDPENPDSDLLLASASQDKYIRLWRVHQGRELPAAAAAGSDPATGAFLPGKSLSNKAHRFMAEGKDYSATFEALLLGHEDWIYSTTWHRKGETLQLLSASADNSLSIWEPDPSSGVWVSVARLGDISAQKGSTTATGSTGGFWTGLWAPNGQTVVCLGRTGSWRLWKYDAAQDLWLPCTGISGHSRSVTAIAWSKEGDYLLSTSLDQTTRLHSRWILGNGGTWHEMARPQIHGYDLACIDTLGNSKFVSGAEEKLLRVFNEPKAVADLLRKLCGVQGPHVEEMPDAANMPVLGLSNKAIDAVADDVELETPNHQDRDAVDPASVMHKSTLDLDHPPLEDHLSRNTLWPEMEKLYGHGYEISALAASHDGSLVATACKASSIDHAVIRLFETTTWHEIKPPLAAHSLTITRLRFSPDDARLLSVGRDRQWAVFARGSSVAAAAQHVYTRASANLKAHSRMILDAAWAPSPRPAFATAGRDKQVRLWSECSAEPKEFACQNSITEEAAITAVDFADAVSEGGRAYLAVGMETGRFAVYVINLSDMAVVRRHQVDSSLCPSRSVTQLAWRPSNMRDTAADAKMEERDTELAVASEDCSLRIYSLRGILSASAPDAALC